MALLSTPGCGAGGSESTLLVFAAASLSDAFEELGEAFETAHPGMDVDFSFGSSAGLAQQVLDGAPADVFASADVSHVVEIVDAGTGQEVVPFARNRLVLAVPRGNPGRVSSLADVTDEALLVGVCAPHVPCGRAARSLFASVGVAASVDTEEIDARSLLSKLAAGELDVGLAYRTDVQAAGGTVDVIDVTAGDGEITYAATVVIHPRPAATADRFVAFIGGTAGQSILRRHGFLTP
ncbi:MAG: molybdate ABC transporter substrate-binding protein [Acidimicrobiales bacterium]